MGKWAGASRAFQEEGKATDEGPEAGNGSFKV